MHYSEVINTHIKGKKLCCTSYSSKKNLSLRKQNATVPTTSPVVHYNGGDLKRKKRGLSDTTPPMVNFTITPLNVNGTNSSSLPFVVNNTGASATIELIVTTSAEEEEADNDSTDVTAQKLLVVSCCEKEED